MTDLSTDTFDPRVIDGLPRWHPAPDLLELVELELDGALSAESPASASQRLPHAAAPTPSGGGGLVLEDAEGTPVALYRPDGDPALTPLRPFTHGPLRRHRRTPTEVGAALGPDADRGRVRTIVVTEPFSARVAQDAAVTADRYPTTLLWLVVIGTGRSTELSPAAMLRAVRAVHASVGAPGLVVPVAVPAVRDRETDERLLSEVARAYGGGGEVSPPARPGTPRAADGAPVAGPAGPLAEAEPMLPELEQPLHPAFARELAREAHPAHARGVTLFFTGLSGSGKSTVAKALAERIADDTSRTVSLLDGDEVRRLLSAGLTFSREDRDLNIRRIGYVATEVTRHGGVAICAPIAPFAAVREEVRSSVSAVGDFLLIHVATPLEECERRDRKGLYARARRGEIPDFTGISSPYEVPESAELRLDTTGRTIDDCVDEVWALLLRHGYLA